MSSTRCAPGTASASDAACSSRIRCRRTRSATASTSSMDARRAARILRRVVVAAQPQRVGPPRVIDERRVDVPRRPVVQRVDRRPTASPHSRVRSPPGSAWRRRARRPASRPARRTGASASPGRPRRDAALDVAEQRAVRRGRAARRRAPVRRRRRRRWPGPRTAARGRVRRPPPRPTRRAASAAAADFVEHSHAVERTRNWSIPIVNLLFRASNTRSSRRRRAGWEWSAAMRVTIVGGGILGTAHALEAVRRGHEVVQLEREAEARGATVRNFGLVWVSGRARAELAAALRSRELWEKLGAEIPGIGFRPAGSLTLLRTPREVAVAEEVVARADAEMPRLRPARARTRCARSTRHCAASTLRACTVRATPRSSPGRRCPRCATYMAATGRYTFLPAPRRRSVDGHDGASTTAGTATTATWCSCAPGAAHGGLVRELAGDLPVRRVRLQMMQTEPLGEPLTTAIADGDSFRYYPGFAGSALDALRRQRIPGRGRRRAPDAAAVRAAPARRADDRRHPRIRRAVRVRRVRGALRLPGRRRRGVPRPGASADPAALGGRLQPVRRPRSAGVPDVAGRRRLGDHRSRRPRHDARARASPSRPPT